MAIAAERLDAAGCSHFMLGGTSSGTHTDHAARNFIAIAKMVEDTKR